MRTAIAAGNLLKIHILKTNEYFILVEFILRNVNKTPPTVIKFKYAYFIIKRPLNVGFPTI